LKNKIIVNSSSSSSSSSSRSNNRNIIINSNGSLGYSISTVVVLKIDVSIYSKNEN